MATARKHITYEEFIANAGAIFDQVAAEGTSLLVERDGHVFAIVPRTKRRQRKTHRFTREDSLFDLAGAGSSAEPTDIARHKDDYIADAILGEQRP